MLSNVRKERVNEIISLMLANNAINDVVDNITLADLLKWQEEKSK